MDPRLIAIALDRTTERAADIHREPRQARRRGRWGRRGRRPIDRLT